MYVYVYSTYTHLHVANYGYMGMGQNMSKPTIALYNYITPRMVDG